MSNLRTNLLAPSVAPFAAETLLRAMAPVGLVIDVFLRQECSSSSPSPGPGPANGVDKTDCDDACDGDLPNPWIVDSQGRFARMIASTAAAPTTCDGGSSSGTVESEPVDWDAVELRPSHRYIRDLVLRYVSRLENDGTQNLEDEDLASLICHVCCRSSAPISKPALSTNGPDPTASCIVSFDVDGASNNTGSETAKDDRHLLGIRVYPHHNDVGVRKLWEAGACVTEYLLQNPEMVRNRRVVELGAGVGLTGLVAAGLGAVSVVMTDCTEATLDNLAYNVELNEEWLRTHGAVPETVGVGFLEWGEYAKDDDEIGRNTRVSTSNSYGDQEHIDCVAALTEADILIAADVVYDITEVAALVASVRRFLDCPPNNTDTSADTKQNRDDGFDKVAFFATTFRNENTFAFFEKELTNYGIKCSYASAETQNSLPYIFPCYFEQPRTDVRLCKMTIST